MKPDFALFLDPERITLKHRSGAGWQEVGSVSLDEADWAARLGYLQQSASGLAPGGMATRLILPNSQILYTTLPAPGPDEESRRRQIAEGLDGLTPYAVEELVFDWCLPESGEARQQGLVRLAVVARETLEEAEAFALARQFNPVCFAAAPPEGCFSGEAFFGPTENARRLMAAAALPGREGGEGPQPRAPGREALAADCAPRAGILPDPALRDPAPPDPDLPDPALSDPTLSDPAPPQAPAQGPSSPPGQGAIPPGRLVLGPPAASPPPPAAPSEKPPHQEPARAPQPPTAAPPAGGNAPHDAAPLIAPAPQASLAPPRIDATREDATREAPTAADTPETEDAAAAADGGKAPEGAAQARAAPEDAGREDGRQRGPEDGKGGGEEYGKGDSEGDGEGCGEGDGAEKKPAPQPSRPGHGAATPLEILLDGARAMPPGAMAPPPPEPDRQAGEAEAGKNPLPTPASGMPAPATQARRSPRPGKPLPAEPAARAPAAISAPPAPASPATPHAPPAPAARLPGRPPAPAAPAAFLPVLPFSGAPQAPPRGLLAVVALAFASLCASLWVSFAAPQRHIAATPAPSGKEAADLPAAAPGSAAQAGVQATPAGPAPEIGGAPPPPLAPEAPGPGLAQGAPEAMPGPAGAAPPPHPAISSRPMAPAPGAPDEIAAAPAAAPPAAAPASAATATATAEAAATASAAGTSPAAETAPGPATLPGPIAPPARGTAPAIPADDTYIASIDPEIASPDALALPRAPATDPAPPARLSRLPDGTGSTADERALTPPAPEGAPDPEGVMVQAAAPPAKPPPRPAPGAERGTAAPETAPAAAPPQATPEPLPQAAASPASPDVAAPQAPPAADPRLAGLRPQPRPEGLVETAERARLGGYSRAELAALRPRPRPASPQNARGLDETPTAQAVSASLRPSLRPAQFAKRVAIIRAARAAAPATAPASGSRPAASAAPVAPRLPTRASVAAQATIPHALRLRKLNLIGVYGTPSRRRALVRLANGRYVKVQVGDRLNGGKVIAIGESSLRYQKNGRNHELRMPKS